MFIRYTAYIPNNPPNKVDNSGGSDRKYIENTIAVIGTRKIYELALLGPRLIDAKKYIEVPNAIANIDKINKLNQKIQSK